MDVLYWVNIIKKEMMPCNIHIQFNNNIIKIFSTGVRIYPEKM